MTRLTPAELTAALHWRYATKAFDAARKIPADVWHALETSMVMAPSAFGLQPWRFFVVNTPALRERIRAAAYGQAQVTDASHYVVLARKAQIEPADIDRLIHATASTRSVPHVALDPYKQVIAGFVANPSIDVALWTTKQTYIALGFLLETAALLGVDACPMEGLNPQAVDEVLGLPAMGYHMTVGCALGYRAHHDKYAEAKKVRFPHGEVIAHL